MNALFLGWRVSPLGLTAAVRKQRAFKGHCLHQWPADAMRVVGDLPTIGFEIDEDLRRGFTQSERRMAGHWLRDAREEGARRVRWCPVRRRPSPRQTPNRLRL